MTALRLTPLVVLLSLFFAAPASAIRLVVPDDASVFTHALASLVLYAHIGGGALGIASGIVASLSVKGGRVHRKAGVVFFWSMLLCYVIGAIVAPLLDSQQSTNFVAAILALYLLLSGVSAAKRRRFDVGIQEKAGLVVAGAITLLGGVFMYMASQSPDGSLDGSPPQAYVLFIVSGGLAFIGELRLLLKKSLSRHGRIVRHLWRMSMSFFIASGSAFFGQAAFFPEWFNASPLPLLFGFFPLVVMVIYGAKYAIVALRTQRAT